LRRRRAGFEILSFIVDGTSFLAWSCPDAARLSATSRFLRDATTVEWPGFSYLLSVELLALPGQRPRMTLDAAKTLRLTSVQEIQHLASYSYSTLRKATWAAMALRAQFDRWFVWDLREECKAIGELSAVWTGYSTGDQDMHDDKSVLKIKLVRSRCDRKPSSLVEAIQASPAWRSVVEEREYRDEIDGVVSRFSDLSPSLDGNIIAWSATPHNSLAMRRQTSDQTLDRSRADSSPIFTPAAPDGPVGLPL